MDFKLLDDERKCKSRKIYRPEEIELKVESGVPVVVDSDLIGFEGAILMTLGHEMTDLSEEMLQDFAQQLVKEWNRGNCNKMVIDYEVLDRGTTTIDIIKPHEEGKIHRMNLKNVCGAEICEIAKDKVKKHNIKLIEVDKAQGGTNLIEALRGVLEQEGLDDVKVKPTWYVQL